MEEWWPGSGRHAPEGCQRPGAHPEHGTEWGALLAQNFHAKVLELVEGGCAGVREEQNVERVILRQGLLLDGQGQQRRLEFEVRLVGQNGLSLRVCLQLLRGGLGSANQIGLVGDVGHDQSAHSLQAGAEGVVQGRAGLDHVSAGIALGAQASGIVKASGREVSSKAFSSRMAAGLRISRPRVVLELVRRSER